jgi:hypothetical protein
MKILENAEQFLKGIFVKKPKPTNLATEQNFWTYLNYNFFQTYLQFRLKYYIHDIQQSHDYRKLKIMWDVFLVGLERAYIIGLAKIILPLPKHARSKNKGEQKYSNQVAIETWLPNFKIKDKEAKKHLIDWRHKALAHIDAGMRGRVNRVYMASLMDEVMDAMAEILKSYKPSFPMFSIGPAKWKS